MPNYTSKTRLTAKKYRGQPVAHHYDRAIAQKVCDHVANGGSMRALMREDKTIPSYYVLFGWMQEHPDFEERYRLSRMMNADSIFDEIMDIADTPIDGIMTVERANGNTEITKKDAIEHRRLQVETRKWMVEKLAPRKYGNKISAEISGPDGQPLEMRNVSDEQRVKALADFIAKTKGLPAPTNDGS